MRLSFWEITPVALFIVFIAPVAIVLVSLTGDYSDNWTHLYQYVLTRYIANTVYLVTGVSILVTIVGVGTAWLITNYNFTGKNIFEWGLILPLAVPPYILAYTFTGLFDTYGTANNLKSDSISICGKTGTAQNPHGEDHSIFIAFAPKENPEIAIAVYIENGGWGSTWAAPIAGLMIEKYLKADINLDVEKFITNGIINSK